MGLGVNLSELLFSEPGLRDTTVGLGGARAPKYIQVPYTYMASDGNPGR